MEQSRPQQRSTPIETPQKIAVTKRDNSLNEAKTTTTHALQKTVPPSTTDTAASSLWMASSAQPIALPRPLRGHKSLVMRTTPRIPSNLRMVVAPELPDMDAGDTEYINSIDKNELGGNNTASGSHQRSLQRTDISPYLPMLRREWSEPVLTSYAKRPASSIKCLPYPHTLDRYIPKQRPCSINTLSNASCRLSIVTVDQEYKRYSFKKQTEVAIHPSMFRGWMQKYGGKLMYSLGQVVASPTLILKGNHDIIHGTIQMNMSRQRAAQNKGKNKLSRKKVESSSKTRKNARSKSRSTLLEAQRRLEESASDSNFPSAISPEKCAAASIAKEPANSSAIGVIEMAAAAEVAADMEIAVAAYSLLAARQSDSANPSVSGNEYCYPGTALDSAYGTLNSGSQGYIVGSPLSGPTRSSSAELSTGATLFLDKSIPSKHTTNKPLMPLHDGTRYEVLGAAQSAAVATQ
ncbi:hypothetical protein LPJ59_001830 [Coemansia sp. RSA 2399]|nr:hypothetical protein LPJ59_001830 [Coemansia sp. RSA 2399]